jgi:hypothetical protein
MFWRRGKRVASESNEDNRFTPAAESRLSTRINSLLCVVLNDTRRTNLGFAWILSGIAQASPLPQQVPALIQFDLDFHELIAVCAGRRPSRP